MSKVAVVLFFVSVLAGVLRYGQAQNGESDAATPKPPPKSTIVIHNNTNFGASYSWVSPAAMPSGHLVAGQSSVLQVNPFGGSLIVVADKGQNQAKIGIQAKANATETFVISQTGTDKNGNPVIKLTQQ